MKIFKTFARGGWLLAALIWTGQILAQGLPGPVYVGTGGGGGLPSPVYVNSNPTYVGSGSGYVIPRGGGLAVPAPITVAPVGVSHVGAAGCLPAVPITAPVKPGKAVVLESYSSTTRSETTFTPGPTWRDPRVTQGIGATLGEPARPARRSVSWDLPWSRGSKETWSDAHVAPAVTMTGQGGVVATTTTTHTSSYQKTIPQRGGFGGVSSAPRRGDVLVVPPPVVWPAPK